VGDARVFRDGKAAPAGEVAEILTVWKADLRGHAL
jgi:hypothetical protein